MGYCGLLRLHAVWLRSSFIAAYCGSVQGSATAGGLHPSQYTGPLGHGPALPASKSIPPRSGQPVPT